MNNLLVHIKNITNTFENLKKLGGYSDDNINDDFISYLTDKYNDYINKFNNIFDPSKQIKEDMKYFADVRTLAKYNENIISGWLVEDFFIFLFKLDIFKEHDFLLNFNSHDSDRIIKKEREYINSDPDFNIIHNDIEFKLEVQALLIPYNKFHIKKNKADRLDKYTSFLLCLLLSHKKIVFFYPDDISDLGILTNIEAFGGKEGYEYIIENIPKNKIINYHSLEKKIVLLCYWFYYYKKLDKHNFIKFVNNMKKDILSIDDLLIKLKDI